MIEKILFVENMDLNFVADNPMSTLYPLRCVKIENMNTIFDTYNIGQEQDIDISRNYKHVLFGFRSIHLYKIYRGEMKDLIKKRFEKLLHIPNKYFLIQDMHNKTYRNISILCDYLNSNNINIIFTFYNNYEAKLIRNLTPNCHHYHLPLHIDHQTFYNKNLDKIYDILLYGSIHPRHYPFRKRLFELLLNNKHKYNIHYIEKPELFNPSICEDGLADYINKSKITIATKSRYDYQVAKYLEIVFCKSLIAGNIPSDGKYIFNNNILQLDNNMSDQEILNNIDHALENYDEYKVKIDNLHNKLFTNYNLDNYVIKLIKIIIEKIS